MPIGKPSTGQIVRSKACTPHDSTDNALFGKYYANAVYVGGAGNVVFVKDDGTTETFVAVAAGSWHSVQPFKRIDATNTTATGIHVGITA